MYHELHEQRTLGTTRTCCLKSLRNLQIPRIIKILEVIEHNIELKVREVRGRKTKNEFKL